MKGITITKWALTLLLGAAWSLQALAETYTESNRKVIYMRESGSGPEQKHAAIKLDNLDSLSAGCFEDILILDVSTAAGKQTYKELQAVFKSKAPLKTITFSKDEEGDCRLESFQK